MPPEVGKTGPGFKPISQTASEEVQKTNSTEVEKKSAESTKDNSNSEAPVRRQASAKETSDKRADVAKAAEYNRRELNQKLNQKIIKGTSGDDKVHISKAPGLLGALAYYEVEVNGQKRYLTGQQLDRTKIQTGAGNDTVVVDSNVKRGVKVHGGRGNDLIIGGSGDDRLEGGKGNDIILGRGGHDKLYGGGGEDTIKGGTGNDYIDGGRGKDNNTGGDGFDYVKVDWKDIFGNTKKK